MQFPRKNPQLFKAFSLAFLLLLFASCSKDPGSGGTSTLKGKVKVIEYNDDFTAIKAEYYAQDEDVYLIYGDDQEYSDDYKTNPDGSFVFKYLRKGKYTIYVYSADSSGQSASGTTPLYTSIEVTKNNQDVDMGEITILTSSHFNSGTSTICGRVWVRNYTADFSVLLGQYYGYDEDVFLVHGNDQYYSDDVKTDVNGWYCFERVPIGHYTVYSVSKDSTGLIPGGYYPVEKEVDITENYQHVVLDDIIILK